MNIEYLTGQILNGLSLGVVYALVALGFAMVYGVLKMLNFAHSEVFTSGAFAGYYALDVADSCMPNHPVAAIAFAFASAGLVAGCVAAAIERIAYRPLEDLPRVSMLLAAIGVSILLQNVGIHLFSAHTRGFPVVELPVSPRVGSVGVLVVSFATLQYFIFHTNAGARMRAVAENPLVAELMGIDRRTTVVLTFFVGGVFAGIAGVVWGLCYGTISPQMGFQPCLHAFVVAVLGSIGNLRGTFAMGVALGLTETLVRAYLPAGASQYDTGITLLILLAFLAARPTGLLGSTQHEKV